MSSVSEASGDDFAGRSVGRTVGAIILVIIGIIAIVAAILYFTEPAHSLPSMLGKIAFNGHNTHRANSHRTLRGVVSIIIGIVLLGGGGFAFAYKPKEN